MIKSQKLLSIGELARLASRVDRWYFLQEGNKIVLTGEIEGIKVGLTRILDTLTLKSNIRGDNYFVNAMYKDTHLGDGFYVVNTIGQSDGKSRIKKIFDSNLRVYERDREENVEEDLEHTRIIIEEGSTNRSIIG